MILDSKNGSKSFDDFLNGINVVASNDDIINIDNDVEGSSAMVQNEERGICFGTNKVDLLKNSG